MYDFFFDKHLEDAIYSMWQKIYQWFPWGQMEGAKQERRVGMRKLYNLNSFSDSFMGVYMSKLLKLGTLNIQIYYMSLTLQKIWRWNIAICDNMDRFWEYYAKRNKSGGKEKELYGFTHMSVSYTHLTLPTNREV